MGKKNKLKLFSVTNSVPCEDHFNVVAAYNKSHALQIVEESGTFYSLQNIEVEELKIASGAGILYQTCVCSY